MDNTPSMNTEELYITSLLIEKNHLYTTSDLANINHVLSSGKDQYFDRDNTKCGINHYEIYLNFIMQEKEDYDFRLEMQDAKVKGLDAIIDKIDNKKPLEYLLFLKNHEKDLGPNQGTVLKYYSTLYLESMIDALNDRVIRKDYTEAERLVIDSIRLIQENNLNDSWISLQEASRVSPEYSSPLTMISGIERAKDNLDRAIEYASKAIIISPLCKHAWYERAVDYWVMNKQKEALADINEALSIDPGYNDAIQLKFRLFNDMNISSSGPSNEF